MKNKKVEAKIKSFKDKHTTSCKDWYSRIPSHLKPTYHNPSFEDHGIEIPFRMLIVGGSGSGKTTCITEIIHRMKDTFGLICLCVRNSNEPLYEYLKSKLDEEQLIIFEEGEIPAVSDFDELDCQVLCIFDDLVNMKCQRQISEHFIRGRKAAQNNGISYIYSTQSYFAVPKMIRLQCNYLILKKLSSTRDLKMILRDFSLGLTPTELLNLYEFATKEFLNFLMVDMNKPREMMWRKGFFEIISIDGEN